MDDAKDMRQARNAVLYNGASNSIVEWTLSPEWTTAPRVLDSRGNRLARGHKVSGITTNEVVGEIECR